MAPAKRRKPKGCALIWPCASNASPPNGGIKSFSDVGAALASITRGMASVLAWHRQARANPPPREFKDRIRKETELCAQQINQSAGLVLGLRPGTAPNFMGSDSLSGIARGQFALFCARQILRFQIGTCTEGID